MAAFKRMLLQELKNHLVRSKKSLNKHEAQKKEIVTIIDNQIKPGVRKDRREGGDPTNVEIDNITDRKVGENMRNN